MGSFKITTEDGTFNVTADTPEDALAAIDHASKQGYMGPTDQNGVPEGMVYDKATNRMVDAKALANKEINGGSWAGDALKGMPFLGEYADEMAGWLTSSNDTKNHPNESQAIQTEVARQAQKEFEDKNPKTALASKLAVGATTLPAALYAAPAALPTSITGRVLVGAPVAAALSGVEGAISGYGQGVNQQDQNGQTIDTRAQNAKDRAITSAEIGGAIGAVAPFASSVISGAAKRVLDTATVNRTLAKIGLNRPAADTLSATLKADDTLGPIGQARLAKAGPDAMLADAGDTAAGLLDTTIQKSGEAGRIASMAVQKRANEAASKLNGTMDLVLGKPPGVNTAAQEIYQKSAAARTAAYNAAYAQPIDYASSAGRQIEDVFARTPSSILGPAIKRANDTMLINGMKNSQIMASIADDGTVTFRQMPNVVQADYLKRALNDISESSKDARGILSPEGVDASKLAKDLRGALVKAVPEYATAAKLGGDTIEQKNALNLGYKLLSPSTTREEVATAVDGITDAERKQMMLGVRQQIDDAMANVTQAMSDPNIDAREAAKALKDMSSRSSREKLVLALGDQRANALFSQLDKAQAAISLKAAVVQNSKTFARQQTAKTIEERGKDSIVQAAREGRPLEVPRRAWQQMTGGTPDAQQERINEIYSQIANVLTGPRGADASNALQQLLKAYQTGQVNATTAKTVGNLATGALALPAYLLGPQALGNRQ